MGFGSTDTIRPLSLMALTFPKAGYRGVRGRPTVPACTTLDERIYKEELICRSSTRRSGMRTKAKLGKQSPHSWLATQTPATSNARTYISPRSSRPTQRTSKLELRSNDLYRNADLATSTCICCTVRTEARRLGWRVGERWRMLSRTARSRSAVSVTTA